MEFRTIRETYEKYFFDLPNFFCVYLSSLTLDDEILVKLVSYFDCRDQKMLQHLHNDPIIGDSVSRATELFVGCKEKAQNEWYFLKSIPYQTEEICKIAVHNWALNLRHVKEQTEDICKIAVEQNGGVLGYVQFQTEEICKIAVQNAATEVLKYVKEQTEEICLLAVRKNGFNLKWVVKQTQEICRTAILQNGEALKFVKDQTKELCLLALRRNNYFLEYVDKSMPWYGEICKLTVNKDPFTISLVDAEWLDKAEYYEICKMAIKKDPRAAKCIGSGKKSKKCLFFLGSSLME